MMRLLTRVFFRTSGTEGSMWLVVTPRRIWEQQHSIPDPVQAAGESGRVECLTAAFRDRQEVNAMYAEMRVPFVTSTMNVPFVYNFEMDYAYRFEEFDDTGPDQPKGPLIEFLPNFDNGGNHRVTIRYQSTPDLLLRGTNGLSFRSPTPGDLFFPTFQDFPVVFDPLKGSTLQPPEGVWIRGQHGTQAGRNNKRGQPAWCIRRNSCLASR